MINLMLKRAGKMLVPADRQSEDAIEELSRGEVYRCKLTKPRNLWHHRKWFALLNVAFDFWSPPEDPEFQLRYGIVPEKNFDQFRKDITILAGFYTASTRLNGEVRVEAKSISFANMDQDQFEDLYEKTLVVLISKVFGPDNELYTRDEIERIVTEIAEFG